MRLVFPFSVYSFNNKMSKLGEETRFVHAFYYPARLPYQLAAYPL